MRCDRLRRAGIRLRRAHTRRHFATLLRLCRARTRRHFATLLRCPRWLPKHKSFVPGRAGLGLDVTTLPSDESWMGLALEEARLASAHGDVPIGAIVVNRLGQELGRGHNRREFDKDPTAHAEILALRAAAHKLGDWRLSEATLYVTLEPCAMCAGALVNARVARVVFAAHDPKAGAVQSLFVIGQDPRLNHRFRVEGGVARQRAAQLLSEFFARLRV